MTGDSEGRRYRVVQAGQPHKAGAKDQREKRRVDAVLGQSGRQRGVVYTIMLRRAICEGGHGSGHATSACASPMSLLEYQFAVRIGCRGITEAVAAHSPYI